MFLTLRLRRLYCRKSEHCWKLSKTCKNTKIYLFSSEVGTTKPIFPKVLFREILKDAGSCLADQRTENFGFLIASFLKFSAPVYFISAQHFTR